MAGEWRRARSVAALVVTMMAAAAPAAGSEPLERRHEGVVLLALAADPARAFDIAIVPPAPGLDALEAALERLLAASPFSRRAIGRLQDAGRVVLAYDPNFPEHELSGLTIAAFFPEFFKHGGRGADFVAVVGRFGVKWPTDELAAVIAHELVGHGVQHLRGRLEQVRNVDLECEASLYQEQAHQDLGMRKRAVAMIRFRKALENRWCADFKRWMRRAAPDAAAYWDRLDPAVPELLEVFGRYIEDLRETGVAGRAVAAARDERRRRAAARVAALARAATPDAHYRLGRMYDRGLGVDQDGGEAARWYELAAAADHLQAQTALGVLLYNGVGVARDHAAARTWLHRAADRGDAGAQALLGQMWINGDGGPRNLATGLGWLTRAAAQGHAGARDALRALDADADAATGG